MRLILTADLHYGYGQRLNDTNWATARLNDYAIAHGIDTVICLGDFFHNPNAIGIDVICAAYDMLVDARQRGINWIAFPGNHDMFLKHDWSINSVRPLSGVLEVIDRVKMIVIGKRRLWVVPFIANEAAYLQVIDLVEAKAEPNDVLLTHIGVCNAIKNPCFMLKDWSKVTFAHTTFCSIYTGHFHTYQQVGRVCYPGSLIPFKFDEGDCAHGFLVYDTVSNLHEFVDVCALSQDGWHPRLFLTIQEIDLETLTDAEIRHNAVRVVVPPLTHPDLRDIRQRLLDMGAVAVKWLRLPGPTQTPQVRPIRPIANPFEDWLVGHEQPLKEAGLLPGMLRQLNRDVCADGDAIYSSNSADDSQ